MPRLAEPTAVQPVESAMVPRLFRLVDRRQDTADTFTIMLEPNDGVPLEIKLEYFERVMSEKGGELKNTRNRLQTMGSFNTSPIHLN